MWPWCRYLIWTQEDVVEPKESYARLSFCFENEIKSVPIFSIEPKKEIFPVCLLQIIINPEIAVKYKKILS